MIEDVSEKRVSNFTKNRLFVIVVIISVLTFVLPITIMAGMEDRSIWRLISALNISVLSVVVVGLLYACVKLVDKVGSLTKAVTDTEASVALQRQEIAGQKREIEHQNRELGKQAELLKQQVRSAALASLVDKVQKKLEGDLAIFENNVKQSVEEIIKKEFTFTKSIKLPDGTLLSFSEIGEKESFTEKLTDLTSFLPIELLADETTDFTEKISQLNIVKDGLRKIVEFKENFLFHRATTKDANASKALDIAIAELQTAINLLNGIYENKQKLSKYSEELVKLSEESLKK